MERCDWLLEAECGGKAAASQDATLRLLFHGNGRSRYCDGQTSGGEEKLYQGCIQGESNQGKTWRISAKGSLSITEGCRWMVST